MQLSNKAYDILKALCSIWLPATAVFLVTVLSLFQVDDGLIKLIAGIFAAVETYIGALIKDSSDKYWEAKA